ncbi:MAG: hypothetical protein QM762_11435 [Chryseolinea sp.]
MIRIIELAVNGVFAVVGLALFIAALRYPKVAFVEIPTVIFRTFINIVREAFFVTMITDLFSVLGSKSKAIKRSKPTMAKA